MQDDAATEPAGFDYVSVYQCREFVIRFLCISNMAFFLKKSTLLFGSKILKIKKKNNKIDEEGEGPFLKTLLFQGAY